MSPFPKSLQCNSADRPQGSIRRELAPDRLDDTEGSSTTPLHDPFLSKGKSNPHRVPNSSLPLYREHEQRSELLGRFRRVYFRSNHAVPWVPEVSRSPPPVPRRPWFRPQLSESEKPLEPRVTMLLIYKNRSHEDKVPQDYKDAAYNVFYYIQGIHPIFRGSWRKASTTEGQWASPSHGLIRGWMGTDL